MKSFIKEFLNEDFEAVPGAPSVYVGAFGKHPGWNDHMDDVGLVTESLVEAKRCLYVQGVSSQIESGAWDRLGAEKALPGFDHVFIWHRPTESIAGLIWSSCDGKGRALYPMILCAQVIRESLDWIWGEVVPRLESTAAACRKGRTQKDVIVAMNMAQEALRRRANARRAQRPKRGSRAPSELGVAEWSAHFRQDRAALRRVCHHLSGNLHYLEADDAGNGDKTHSHAVRLPGFPGATDITLLNAWLRFLGGQLDPFMPMLLVKRRGESWLDVVVGEPMKDDLFCLRAAPTAEPIVSSIPYTVTDDIDRKLEKIFADMESGGMPTASFLSDRPTDEALASAVARLRSAGRPGARAFLSRLLGRK